MLCLLPELFDSRIGNPGVITSNRNRCLSLFEFPTGLVSASNEEDDVECDEDDESFLVISDKSIMNCCILSS